MGVFLVLINQWNKIFAILCFAGLSACAPQGSFQAGAPSPDQSSQSAPDPVDPTTPTTPTTLPPVDIPGRASNAANISVCAGSSTVPGTDVSDYDPNTQWGVLKTSSGFAFIKATEGNTFLNQYFASDWASAKNSGVRRGAYHFFHPADDPATQANFFLNTVGTMDINDLPPVLDLEETDNVDVSTQVLRIKTWLNTVEDATGKVPIIYVSPSFWNALGNPQGFQRYPLFIAHYGVSCPSIPPPWSNWTFWQKGIGPVTGVQDPKADVDIYNGSVNSLFNWP